MNCIADANIWFDLSSGAILEAVFELPVQWHAPDLVLFELKSTPTADDLRQRGIVEVSLTGSQLQESQTLVLQEKERLSIADAALFVLARDNGWILVTGDRVMRELAAADAVECHGTLWLLDMLVESAILSPPSARRSLESMLLSGRRLPKAECELRLERWR